MSTTEERSGLGLYTLKAKAQGGSGFQVQSLLEDGKPVSMEDTTCTPSFLTRVSSRFHFAPVALTGDIMHASHI